VDILRLKYIHKLLDEGGLNIAAIRTLLAIIPCWAIRKCSDEEREKCQGFKSDAYPCWEASERDRSVGILLSENVMPIELRRTIPM